MSWPTTSTGLGHIIFSIVTILGCTNEGPKMMPVHEASKIRQG